MTATHYESHAWGSGVDGDECVACGVTWQDCDEDCTRRPAPAHRAHTGMTTHENGDQTVNENIQGGPWTRHGHPVKGITVVGEGRPPIYRCGGPALCKQCSADAEQIRAEAAR